MRALSLLFGLLLVAPAFAQERPVEKFGDISIYYTPYKSTFLTPQVAEAYGITRADDRGVVNVSVVDPDTPDGLEAEISGSARNLMNMRQELEFTEVKEGEAVYYLATFDFEDESSLTFDLVVDPAGPKGPFPLTFQRTFRTDQP